MSHLENVQSLQNKLLLLNLLTASQLSKTLSAFASQLEPHSIVRFFKCMESSCDFCTDEEGSFLHHLATHQDPIVQCTYCNVATGDADLVRHMVSTHGSSSLQCALCFYRSRTVTHMRVHGLIVHKSKTFFWYACQARRPDEPRLVCASKSHIECYACTGDCTFKTLCMERFLKHLLKDHAGHQKLVCHICSETIDMPGALIGHYLHVHGLYAVHCLYCPFGSQNDWEVVVHVARCHPDNPFKIFCRSERMPQSFKALKDLGKENIGEGIPAAIATSVVSQCKIEGRQGFQETKVALFPNVKSEPVQDYPSEEVQAIGSAPSQVFEISETLCMCGISFYDVAVLMQHMTDRHSLQSSFSCLKCPLLKDGSLGDFFAHLVDEHTAWFRCCYKGCFFLSGSQQAVDDHVIQVHQHFDFPQDEDASPTEQEETCALDGDVENTKSNVVMKYNVGPSDSTEQSVSDSEDQQLVIDIPQHYTCSLCCQSDMEALDYFRHMSLGHGVKFFCGYCDRGYKNRKQMMLHHNRCHEDLQFSVKSFERNSLRDVASLVLSEWESEFEYDAKDKSPSEAPASSAAETVADDSVSEVTEMPVVATKSRVSHFAALPSSVKTSIPGVAPKWPPKDATPITSDVALKLPPKDATQITSESVSCRKKALLDSMNISEAIPLGKRPVTSNKQKVCHVNPNSNSLARQETVLNKTPQINKANPNSTASVSYPCDQSKTVDPHTRDCAPPCENVYPIEKPVAVGIPKACQPAKQGKVMFYCGHCLKGYKLFKCLLKHQESVHPTLPQSVKRVDLTEQDNVAHDFVQEGKNRTEQDNVTHDFVQKGKNRTEQYNVTHDFVQEGKSRDAEIAVNPKPSDTKEEESNETVSEDEDFVTPKPKWRRIRLMFSDSEDEDSDHSIGDDQQEGYSYYGKEVEAIDYENTYVRFSDGDFRIAYCQLANIANLMPIVLVQKGNFL